MKRKIYWIENGEYNEYFTYSDEERDDFVKSLHMPSRGIREYSVEDLPEVTADPIEQLRADIDYIAMVEDINL